METRHVQIPGCSPRTLILACALAATPLSFAVAQDSHYTRHDYETCVEAPSLEPGIIDVRRCDGFAGMSVQWISEPDSSSIQIGDDPLDEYLDLGAAFEVGTTIEWRTGQAGRSPVAAIVRYRSGDSVASLKRSQLVVYRLTPSGRSCVLGVVAGAGDNLKARELADAHAPAFACGTSKRIVR